jgi:hypothetical protein
MSDKSVPLEGLAVEVLTLTDSIAMSINGADRAVVDDYKGRSQMRRQPDGRYEIAVHDSPHWGRPNEPLVRNVLQGALALARGVDVEIKPPTHAEDARGIDGTTVGPDGKPLSVQIVTVPADSDYARCVAQGNHSVLLTKEELVGWIENAIAHKSTIAHADRRSTILALDVRHAAMLATDGFVQAVKQKIRPAELGFAEIWLVANVHTHSARLA